MLAYVYIVKAIILPQYTHVTHTAKHTPYTLHYTRVNCYTKLYELHTV